MRKVIKQPDRCAAKQILATLTQTLSGSDFVELLPIKDPLAGDFYPEMSRIKRWDVRALRQKIGGMLFQRTDGGLFEPAVLDSPKLSTALRVVQVRADRHFNDTYLLKFLAQPRRRRGLNCTATRRKQSGRLPFSGAAI